MISKISISWCLCTVLSLTLVVSCLAAETGNAVKSRLKRQTPPAAAHANAGNPPQHQQQVPIQNQQQQVQHNQNQGGIQPQGGYQQQQQHVQQPQGGYQQRNQALPGPHLALMTECAGDVEKYCPKVKKENDIAVLECLQDLGEDEVEILSGDCEHLVWQFKKNFTQDQKFHRAATQFCAKELDLHPDCKNEPAGHLLGCLLEYKENMTHSQCRAFLTRTEKIAFSDFRLVGSFVEKCTGDVEKFKCGSLLFSKDINPQDKVHHSQGSTLQCLIEKIVEHAGNAKHQDPAVRQDASRALDAQCRHEVLRLAELQSDDYHLDRPLFFACRHDRELFCQGIQGGEGRIYNCLLQHKDEAEMNPDCKHQLVIRAQLIAQDYKVSHSLVQSCQRNMQQYQCVPQADQQTPEHFFLSFVVLCLENAVHSSRPLDPACHQQLVEHRKLMLSDYRMSPEVVLSCADDIKTFCGDTLEGGGRTLHCLMGVESGVSDRRQGHQREDTHKLQDQCKQAITHLVKAADPGGDYRVDVALYRSCRNLIDGVCSQQGNSESDVLSCLMNHVETQDMTIECEDRLLEIQYFMSRDFTLDPKLYKACHRDAEKHCSAPQQWHQEPSEQNQPHPGPQILACLYRNAYNETAGAQLSRMCRSEVIRTLRERAVSVHLMPQIEEDCRMALAAKCSQETRPGEELKCLQEHMEDEDFKKDYQPCYQRLHEFTEEESKDIRLNRALSRACRPVIEAHCKELMDEEIDHGDVMECLQKNKGAHEMNSKCKSYVNFYTLVSQRDYKLSYKFQKACRTDVQKYCHDVSDKTEIIRCLGEVMVNHQVLGETEGLTKDCKRQLRHDFITMENAPKAPEGKDHMESGFWRVCKKDIIDNQCYDEGKAAHEVMECLRRKKQDEDIHLSAGCSQLLFGIERVEEVDNRLDAELSESCGLEIQEFCHKIDPPLVLRCLKKHMRDPGMSKTCIEVVRTRQLEQAQDIRLRPGVLRACKRDLQALCEQEYQQIKTQIKNGVNEEVLEGHAVYCLRTKLTSKDPAVRAKVHPDCETELKEVILESEVDPKMDPVFYKHCKDEIKKFCTDQLLSAGGHGSIMECMKSKYYEHRLTAGMCKTEMGRRTSEELSDIHLDPVLHEACALDIKHYCHDTPPGEGRIVSCLLMASESTNTQLTAPCLSKLRDREKLWKVAKAEQEIYVPDNIAGFGQLLMDSPARNSVFTIFLVVVLVIFAGGLCFGRVTKRVRAEIKNR